LFVWGIDDDMTVVILLLSALSIYLAVDITRLTKGAPRGWYVIITAFLAVLVYWAVQLYFDTQSASDLIDDTEASISIVVGVLFVVGLYMLNSSFRRQVKTAQAS